MVSIHQVGPGWVKAARALRTFGPEFATMRTKALRAEAEFFKAKIIEGIQSQSPGGRPLKPLSPYSVMMRQFLGYKGEKALIQRGDLLRSIGIQQSGRDRFYVGVKRGATSSDGKDLVTIAEIQEKGAGPFVVKITPKMRAFLAMVFRKMNKTGSPGGKGGKGYMLITIPPRPFMGPVFDKYGEPGRARARMLQRFSVLLRAFLK